MNDLKDLLELALTDGHGPDPGVCVDPTGDLVRGRALLLHRRRTRVGGTLAAATAVGLLVPATMTALGAGTATVATPGRDGPGPAASSTPPAGSAGVTPLPAVALVAYDGEQPPGYRVAEVPAGWVIQGSNPQRLTIAVKGSKDTSPDSFVGKLVVMLDSTDAPPLNPTEPGTTPQPVNGRPGVFRVDPGSTPTPAAPAPTTGTCLVAKPGATPTGEARRVKGSGLTPEQRKYLTEVPCSSLPPQAPFPDEVLPPTQILTYRLADGRQMMIEAPVSLGWDAPRLARFAEGVTVLPAAKAGVG